MLNADAFNEKKNQISFIGIAISSYNKICLGSPYIAE